VPHGEWGKVVNVRVFTGDELSAGVNTKVQVWIAQKRPIFRRRQDGRNVTATKVLSRLLPGGRHAIPA